MKKFKILSLRSNDSVHNIYHNINTKNNKNQENIMKKEKQIKSNEIDCMLDTQYLTFIYELSK